MKTTENTASKEKQAVDVYQMITDRIVEALESGTVPWRKTWQGATYASNIVSKTVYSGMNAILTNLSPYPTPYFITMKQANNLGGKIKKGSKSLPIVFWKVSFVDPDGNPVSEEQYKKREDCRKRFLLRYYRVFNIEDVESIEFTLPEYAHDHTPIERCENLVGDMHNPPTIKFGGNQPFYSPPKDLVQVPHLSQFESPEEYYATLFHELIHATGHSKRLNRAEVVDTLKFATQEYSKEELVAELGATFLCNRTGIENPQVFENSTAYIAGWLTLLQDDKRFIFDAANKAQKAVMCIVGK